ncbi:hypothetical protein [Pseudomonas sp. NPDC007930]|uniref:hypothetical protein n=1 Tax=Pseudomonas sp. NPDC007930 TaxID=3364417 RepID=UPI0036E501F1
MKTITSPLCAVALVLSSPYALAAKEGLATLRLSCDDSNQGAEIYINGAFKGECSLDVDVKPGTVQIKAVNKQSQAFEQSVKVAAGTAKRIDVEFGVEERKQAQAAAKAAYDAAWKPLKARWVQLPADSNYDCQYLRDRVDAKVVGARNWSCDCVVEQSTHPAWRQYQVNICNATFEANKIENKTEWFGTSDEHGSGTADFWRFEINN